MLIFHFLHSKLAYFHILSSPEKGESGKLLGKYS